MSAPNTIAIAARPLATAAVAVAAEQADAVDREGRLPTQALDALRADGLLGLLIPSRFGGPGSTLRQVANLCRSLSEACAATGLIFAMHHSQSEVIIRHAGDGAWHHALMEKMAHEQLIVASATTEGATGGSIRRSACFMEYIADNLHLKKYGSVISYAQAGDVLVISARRSDDAAPSDQQMVAALRDQVSLAPLERWNPMGMRGACTDRFDLTAVCHAEQVFPGTFAAAMSQTMLPASHILLSSVWLGIAVSALARAQGFLRQRNRSGVPLNPISNLRLAEAESLVQQMRGTLASCIALYEAGDLGTSASDRMVSYNSLKVGASQLVLEVTNIALRICGIQGYMQEGEFYLSRHIRDAHSAMVMVNDDRILSSMSTVVLGVPLTRDV